MFSRNIANSCFRSSLVFAFINFAHVWPQLSECFHLKESNAACKQRILDYTLYGFRQLIFSLFVFGVRGRILRVLGWTRF
ncbi:hypothetical protein L596_011563 [Steinernema carpocapsae]|uniref:Uncharacterized protein n=1 Tax=Steinernema carpocapsae TaxID=34508 RepID=A0A4U5NV65_STECR|nr:hypothetical protein L596_011563 [Steinernema carpocapsae]